MLSVVRWYDRSANVRRTISFKSTSVRSLLPARANASRFVVIRPMRVASSYIICTVSR